MTEFVRLPRRRVLCSMGGAVAVAALDLPAAAAGRVPHRPASTSRTLALIGDRWHSSDYIRVSLDRLFRELQLPIDYTTNYDQLSAELLKPYQLFLGFRDNMTWPYGYPDPGRDPYHVLESGPQGPSGGRAVEWITEDQGRAVQEFVAAGNGFYSLHNNVFVSLSSKNFREVQGGVALGHPPLRPFRVKIARADHPITRGVRDFMVTDEQHYAIYDKDPGNILLRGENLDGLVYDHRPSPGREPATRNLGPVSISGWAHEYGKGRVVFTAIGHTIHAMWEPEYLKLQKNAVRWLLHMI